MSLYLIVINLLLAIIGIVILLILLELFVRFQRKRKLEKDSYTTLSIRVARENEAGAIVAEQMFATIHGIAKNLSFWDRLNGVGQDQISFEIANTDRSIRFYSHFPSKLRNLIEGQIYAQYPDVEIAEVADYSNPSKVEVSESKVVENINLADSKALVSIQKSLQNKQEKQFTEIDELKNAICVELELNNPDIYPIKRYPQFEDRKAKVPLDTLSSITSTLSKFDDPDEQAWIQVIVQPMQDKWRNVFIKCIRIISKGIYMNIEKLQNLYASAYCTRSRIIRIIFFPVYFIFWLQGLKAGAPTAKNDNVAAQDVLDDQITRTHDRESPREAAIDKVSKLLYEANIRIVYIPKHPNKEVALVKVREIAGSFKQFNIPQVNGFEIGNVLYGQQALDRYRKREIIKPFIMSTEELATVYHMPNLTVTTPNIYWVRSRRVEPPNDLPTPKKYSLEELTILGKTNFRSIHDVFGIKTVDRRRHIYVIGKTGMGKSTLLENMIYSDIMGGKGVAVVDPHGDLADNVLNFIPSHRTNDVVIFDPSDREFPVAFNMLENIDSSLNSIVCSGLVGIFKKIYGDSWGPRLEHILRNTILSLLEYPGTTMLGIPRILQDRVFRRRVVRKITDPIVKGFWENEFDKFDPRQQIEAISPILNKVGQFLSSPILRNILGQPKSAIDLRFAMDKKKIVVVNLSKGKIGEDMSSLLGAMIITKFQLDAMSRSNIPEKDRIDFYLYVDEFQNFATDSFATILSEARKYKLNLTMANQYIAQMPDEVRDAVFGNVGTILSFQVGFDDAEYLSGQFGEEVLPNDLVSLSKYTAYSRLLIEGMPSKTFSLATLPPPELEFEEGRREKVIRLARERYSSDREAVEDKIRRWSESTKKIVAPAAKEGKNDIAKKERGKSGKPQRDKK
jgi:hypothetical protein